MDRDFEDEAAISELTSITQEVARNEKKVNVTPASLSLTLNLSQTLKFVGKYSLQDTTLSLSIILGHYPATLQVLTLYSPPKALHFQTRATKRYKCTLLVSVQMGIA